MKNGVFWDVTPCGSCKNRRFGVTWRLLHQVDKNRWTLNVAVISSRRCVFRLLATDTFLVHRFVSPWWWKRYVPPKRRLFTRTARRNIPKDAILHPWRLISKTYLSLHIIPHSLQITVYTWNLPVVLFRCETRWHTVSGSETCHVSRGCRNERGTWGHPY
jgi:hypothetical protein